MPRISRLFVPLLLLSFSLMVPALADGPASSERPSLPITTKSPKARALFEEGLTNLQTLHLQAAFRAWRGATKEDPNLAIAHIFLAQFSQDPVEQASERDKALATKKFAGPEERLIINWLSHGSTGNALAAIQEMNQAAESYKKDKQVVWLAGSWLTAQQQWGRATVMFERAIALDPNFADAWNNVAYCYARSRQFDKAFAAMKKYTSLLPNEPNPQDSFAEISRMAGRYDQALEHYRASLKIDPSFIESQLGIGDTYALMGKESRARTEYAVAMKKATSVQAVTWSLQSASTYVREGNFAKADKAFLAAAEQAKKNQFGNLEAEAYRMMAMYQSDKANAISYLNQADAALDASHKIFGLLIKQERANILRTRVYRLVQDNDMAAATQALNKLQELFTGANDATISLAYHSAAGVIGLAQGKYEQAIPHLEQDNRNPYSLQTLVTAYEKAGSKEEARQAALDLMNFNEPILEQALVVPAFRKSWPAAHPAAPAKVASR